MKALQVFVIWSVLLFGALPANAHDSNDHPADFIYKPGDYGYTWNKWRIYLSPAHHWAGKKYGCGSYVEDDNMHSVAHVAAKGAGWTLVERGYKVRVGHGDPDDNTRRSNNWGTATPGKRRHIPLHSNARSNDQCGKSEGGTLVFHYPGSSKGENLSRKLKNKLGTVSPGSKYESVRTASFHELKYTDMPAAYVEAEFHDWWKGKNWLTSYSDWAWRIGYAVDLHLGYP